MQLFSGNWDRYLRCRMKLDTPLQEAYELSDTSLQHEASAKAVSNAA